MNRGFFFALLIAGVVLIIFGFQAADSIQSDVSEAVTGTPSDRSLWLFVLGIIALFAGAGGLFFRRK
ncbi:MAG: DUF3185 family protein [Opitutales bacterium]|nr:DUF3185 family protein [Opitutales bacterium]